MKSAMSLSSHTGGPLPRAKNTVLLHRVSQVSTDVNKCHCPMTACAGVPRISSGGRLLGFKPQLGFLALCGLGQVSSCLCASASPCKMWLLHRSGPGMCSIATAPSRLSPWSQNVLGTRLGNKWRVWQLFWPRSILSLLQK